MRQNPAGFPFIYIRVHMRQNSLCKGNLVSSMICLDTKISRVTLETCIFTRLSLRPHSFIVDEQRFRLVSAEERQNHDRQECELKGARPALGSKCHCREHKLRPRSGSVKIFWGGVQQCCWADSFWQSVTDETDLCHQRSAFCPTIGFCSAINPGIRQSRAPLTATDCWQWAQMWHSAFHPAGLQDNSLSVLKRTERILVKAKSRITILCNYIN